MVVKVSKMEVNFLSVLFHYFGLHCWRFLAFDYVFNFQIFSNSATCHLLFRQSTFRKLTLFLCRSLFFCFNCTCKSVNISMIWTPCYKRAFFLYHYQNARATFVCVVGCLKVDLVYVLLISSTFNSDKSFCMRPTSWKVLFKSNLRYMQAKARFVSCCLV